ncbi:MULTISPECIES: EboA domain-containing protein [Streptomyces]|uniref:EboA domain-containing protein n=2 Tax=Streptomyces TaxID=1883 RepID=A0ABU2QWM3_9ACTN|nr:MULTISPECIES: EboA domain-containing protein [unclassified Streptomyces]MDT0407855.1 EboA domain-containing protein [Streptomyces sp. DSM 41979]MYQ58453.1 sugar phosphate isomerase [Streptomyces sp. SID4926]WEH27192.1 EboA domain-containing protein [Streptomyces sp. AM 3-1-1]SCD30352.1 hypothetical protein GA0115252_100437 [Streptomyces sp. DfronAA-171]
MTLTTTTQPAPAHAAVHDALTLRTLKEALAAALDEDREARLRADTEAVGARGAAALELPFAAAGRHYGRDRLPGWYEWHVADAVRTLLLLALPLSGERLAAEATARYGGGDAAERRGVLSALPFLPLGDAALPLVDDGLRTNDTRLIAAALGPYARAHLDQYRWRQAVLKCLFTGVPLHRVAGLQERKDAELARMAAGFAAERRAAGRTVPDDLWLVAGEQSAARAYEH